MFCLIFWVLSFLCWWFQNMFLLMQVVMCLVVTRTLVCLFIVCPMNVNIMFWSWVWFISNKNLCILHVIYIYIPHVNRQQLIFISPFSQNTKSSPKLVPHAHIYTTSPHAYKRAFSIHTIIFINQNIPTHHHHSYLSRHTCTYISFLLYILAPIGRTLHLSPLSFYFFQPFN